MKQEIRKGLQGMEEVDTYEMLDKLKPEAPKRCRKGTKSVGRTCCDGKKEVTIEFDERIGIALSRAADYVYTLPERIDEVRQAADEVLKVGLKQGLKKNTLEN
jgi:hypothetical protein